MSLQFRVPVGGEDREDYSPQSVPFLLQQDPLVSILIEYMYINITMLYMVCVFDCEQVSLVCM